MPRREIEGEFVKGWPDRKRASMGEGKDEQGRIILGKTPVLDLPGVLTPTDAFHIVTQLETPEPMHPDDWTLKIGGLVENPLELSFEDLQKFPGHTVRMVMECAGDDTDFFEWQTKGGEKPSRLDVHKVAFGQGESQIGYVSAGEFTGVSLRTILERSGVKPGAESVYSVGFDKGRPDPIMVQMSAGRDDIEVPDPGVINYDKAMPMAKALDPDTIIAWAMNGEYLQHVHGAPARLVIPGWSGNWSVKWLDRIDVLDYTPDCYYQTQYFVYASGPDDPTKRPLMALGTKSTITSPMDEESPLPAGQIAIRGLAWSGEGAITRVEVSTDGGQTWTDSRLEENRDRFLWTRWFYLWDAKPGKYQVVARATDEKGRIQPQTGGPDVNFQRKHFDGIVPLDMEIV